ncbi:NAD(P)-dependent alcohol dehydrogenase [Microcella humidisoli]|uniref:NAD(P)-dependent alcohol dehydrogenase n=1 Tax=Microcella humidisoli TaxID=2963406 RepID=A0ABY5FWP3_9MICO|nr:NAD(P)-dependent alcohol dehydrogenase [Microcella humidisoli]UTT62725.1 NAD(P)-dependent alcohol dehydrogenase [Microcella humidisoli]
MTTAAPTTATMTAIVQHGYGGPEVLSIDRMPAPSPGPEQVLVRVFAASPDSGTVHLMKGDPYAVRLALGLRTLRQPIIGLAFAGIIEAVGSEVSGFAVGDRVAGSAPAAFAELVVASPAKIARIPDGVSMTDAATLPISAGTALQAVRDSARVQSGQRVLIIGAGGGVGSFMTQLAVAQGARVTGIASAAKAEFVRSLGAERVIDYRATSEPRDWGRFDVIIEAADGRALHVLRRALAERGTLVIVGADKSGGPLLRGADRQLRALLLNPWVRHRLTAVMQRESGDDLSILLEMIAAGSLRAPIDEVVPLERAAEAMDRLARQQTRGKAVIELQAERDR